MPQFGSFTHMNLREAREARVGHMFYREEPEMEAEEPHGVEEISKRSYWIFELYSNLSFLLAAIFWLLFMPGLVAVVLIELGAKPDGMEGMLGFGPIALLFLLLSLMFSNWHKEEQQEKEAAEGLRYVFRGGLTWV